MKIFITGATGFIGSALVKKLKSKKWKLLCIARNIEQTKLKTNNNIKFISFDIYSDKENLFRKYGVPDILIHLAWSGLPNYQENFLKFSCFFDFFLSYFFKMKFKNKFCSNLTTKT